MSCKPTAYTYEADIHCTPCAIARFGADDHGHAAHNAEDSEGNGIGVVLGRISSDGFDSLQVCGTCGHGLCPHCGVTAPLADWGMTCWNCRSCRHCGTSFGDHYDTEDGEPCPGYYGAQLVSLDHGRRDQWQEIDVRLGEAETLVSADVARAILRGMIRPTGRSRVTRDSLNGYAVTIRDLGYAAAVLADIRREYSRWVRRNEWLQHAESEGNGSADATLTEEGFPDWHADALDSITAALADAGYIAEDRGDAGFWGVWAPAEGPLAEHYGRNAI